MKYSLRGIALLLFALILAVIGQTADEILHLISLIVGVFGLVVAFWDVIAALWRKVTAEEGKEQDNS